MAVKVTVTKAEREAIDWTRAFLDGAAIQFGGETARNCAKHRKSLNSLIAKIDAPPKAREPGLGWIALRDSLRERLGSRLALPPKPDGAWYATQNRRIKSVGLSKEDADAIAAFLAGWKRPVIAFEFVTSRLTDLLAEARKGDHEEPVGGGRPGWGLEEFASPNATDAFPD